MYIIDGYNSLSGFLFRIQKPVGGVALFGGDGASFLTESLRSTSSRGEGEDSPGLGKKPASKKQGLGSGLFSDGGDEEEEERRELFESTVR